MIEKIIITNFKRFEHRTIRFKDGLNILVGNNATGKSTILEAIYLALTRKINGRLADYELSPYLFNSVCVSKYLSDLHAGKNPAPPRLAIEVYFSDTAGYEKLRGKNNEDRNDKATGVMLEVILDDLFKAEYADYIAEPGEVRTVPTEFYKVNWFGFNAERLSARSLPDIAFVDATSLQLKSGTDAYLQETITKTLSPNDRSKLAMEYRVHREVFNANSSAIGNVNKQIETDRASITSSTLAVALDMSQKSSWEQSLTLHIDGHPFEYSGKGEQVKIKTLLAIKRYSDARIVLIEEPENHLAYSSMRKLIKMIEDGCKDKQLFVTTHSSYVLNKLGLENLRLLTAEHDMNLADLDRDTQDYFRKLSGYDTLRLILAREAILVEGPSDELIVQKAFALKHTGAMPLDHEVDVINVRGLSFKRYLDIANKLSDTKVKVVTDNDGDYKHTVTNKYKEYAANPNIKICASADDTLKTLEPQFVAVNQLVVLNRLFVTAFTTNEAMSAWLQEHKTEWALQVFETSEEIEMPEYINQAVS